MIHLTYNWQTPEGKEDVLSHLYTLRNKFILIVGRSLSGKTTLAKYLLNTFNENYQSKTLLFDDIDNTLLSSQEFTDLIYNHRHLNKTVIVIKQFLDQMNPELIMNSDCIIYMY
jgi:ABC-type bacteriocin/lantibiotic exporter with double-glycine peptidase domain